MCLGLLLVAASATLPLLVPITAWALAALLDAVVWAVERIAAIPWATVPIGQPDAWFVTALYLLAIVAAVRWYRHRDIPLLAPSAITSKRPGIIQNGRSV